MTVIYFKFEKLPRSNPLVSVIAASLSLQTHACPPARTFILSCVHFSFFLQEAIAANSFFEIPIPFVIKRGDVEAGFAASDHIIEGEMRVGAQVINLSCCWNIIYSLWQNDCLFLWYPLWVFHRADFFVLCSFFYLFFRNISIWKHKQQ